MKKAINIWSFSGRSVKECITIAKEAGYDGLELALEKTGEVSLESTKEELKQIKEYAGSQDIKLHSLATGLFWEYSLTSNNEDIRKKAYEIAVLELETAKALGAEAILLVPGHVGIDFIPGCETVQYDTAYERSLDALMKLKKIAEELEVKIGIENVWNKFLLSPIEMRDFIDKIGSPYVGVYLDVGNIVAIGYPEHWIRILQNRIVKVHFKDYRVQAGGLHGFVDLLAGDVNWKEVMKAFDEEGYDSWVTAEMIPAYSQHSEQIIYNTFGAMSKIIGGR